MNATKVKGNGKEQVEKQNQKLDVLTNDDLLFAEMYEKLLIRLGKTREDVHKIV